MQKSNCTVKFFLNERVNVPLKGSPIYCRITMRRKKAEFATDEFCQPKKWDNKNGAPLVRSNRIKEYLNFIESKIFEIKRELEYQNKNISAKILKAKYKDQSSGKKITFLDHMDLFIEHISQLKEDYGKSRISKYKTTRRYFTNFLESINSKTIMIQDYDLEKIQAFDMYLATNIVDARTQKLIGRNTINNHHKLLKVVLNAAVKKEILSISPYSNFKLKDIKTNREFLTKDELIAFNKVELANNERFDRVRDIFLFSCYTGLRFNDAQNLRSDNISIDSDNNHWLTFEQAKTKQMVRLPLLKPAIEIYNKYEHLRKSTKKIIPKISNQKFNDYIKVVAGLAGVTKNISHHIARHTFATTVTLSNDVPLEVVSNMLGHKDLKTTQIYAKITDENKVKQIDRLNSFI